MLKCFLCAMAHCGDKCLKSESENVGDEDLAMVFRSNRHGDDRIIIMAEADGGESTACDKEGTRASATGGGQRMAR